MDVPDDRGIYHKWIVCRDEPANQSPKYLILPVNYELTWIENLMISASRDVCGVV